MLTRRHRPLLKERMKCAEVEEHSCSSGHLTRPTLPRRHHAPTHTTKACGAEAIPGAAEVGVLVLSEYVEPAYACGFSRSTRNELVTCSRNESSTLPCRGAPAFDGDRD